MDTGNSTSNDDCTSSDSGASTSSSKKRKAVGPALQQEQFQKLEALAKDKRIRSLEAELQARDGQLKHLRAQLTETTARLLACQTASHS